MKNLCFHLLLFLFLVGSLVSCRSEPSSILQDTSCSPPCWYHIIPGKSNIDDVRSILPSINVIDSETIKEAFITIEGFNDNIYWLATPRTGDYGGRIYFKDGIVSVIEVDPKKGALTIADAIEKLGEPEEILAYSDVGDRPRLVTFILYPSKGYGLLSVNEYFSLDTPAEIKSDQRVLAVYFFYPELFEIIMTNGPMDKLTDEILQQGLHPWTGFGHINYIDRYK